MKKLALALGGIALGACGEKIYKGIKNTWDKLIFKDLITLRKVIKQYEEIEQIYPSYLNDPKFLEFRKTHKYDAEAIHNIKDHLFSDLKKEKLIQIGTTMEAFMEYSDKYLQDDITVLKISWRFCAIRLKFDSALLQLQDINKIV
ncbi:hypothetical protein KSM86_000724 [Campylobacter coli]|uniref:hypothetical protein n=1 Tax=Campylobacter coli TaxID=195 RepID=UPI0008F4EF9D|nr:hypothetical protein [Campylobacter coli]APA57013.1 hypothetical protein BLD33_00655 [Campylobacter coli]APA58666.1 hypothetical protein BLD33_09545 [Campylobacter coli]EAC1561971.1 hypothetical protein [Campylobacter coli]EAC1594299.1 hypothetical protein [Campylobacter coli]EAC1928789.1 hypothetical protein [Campylobacter coli]